jgi:hypothetical protein
MAYVTISQELLIKEQTKIPIEEYRKLQQGYGEDIPVAQILKSSLSRQVSGRRSLNGMMLSPTKVSLESRKSVSFGYQNQLSPKSSDHDSPSKKKTRKPSLSGALSQDQAPKGFVLKLKMPNMIGTSSSKSINCEAPQELTISDGRLDEPQNHSIEFPRGNSFEKILRLSNFSSNQQLLMTTGKLQGSFHGSQRFSWGTNKTPKFARDHKTSPRNIGVDESNSYNQHNGGSGRDYTSEKVSIERKASQKISNFFVTFKGNEESQQEINMRIVPMDSHEGPLSSENYQGVNRMKTAGISHETIPSEAKSRPIKLLKFAPTKLGLVKNTRQLLRGAPLVKRPRTPALKKHLGDLDEHHTEPEQKKESPILHLPNKSYQSLRRFSAASGFNMNVESVDSENMFLVPSPIIHDSQSNQQYTILAGISSMLNSADPRHLAGGSSSTKKGNKSKDSSNLIKSVLRPKDFPPTPEMANASERSCLPRSVISIDKDYSKVPSFSNLKSHLGAQQPSFRSKISSSRIEDNNSGQILEPRSQQHHHQLPNVSEAEEAPINLDTNLDIEGELSKNIPLLNYIRALVAVNGTLK